MASVPQFVAKKKRERVMLAASLTAGRLLDEMTANGGALEPQPQQPDGLARVLLTFEAGADRQRCRALYAEMKVDAKVWGAVLRAVSLSIGKACDSSVGGEGGAS